MIDYVWGAINTMARAILVDGNLSAFIYNQRIGMQRLYKTTFHHMARVPMARLSGVQGSYSMIWAHRYFFIICVRLVSGAILMLQYRDVSASMDKVILSGGVGYVTWALKNIHQ